MRIAVEGRTDLPGDIELVAVAVTSPFDRSADDLGLPQDVAQQLVDEARAANFDGELGTSVFTAGGPRRWYALIGAGASPRPTDYRRVGSQVVRVARTLKLRSAAVLGASSADRARFTTEGAYLTGYEFDPYKSMTPEREKRPPVSAVTIVADDAALPSVARGVEVAESICVARDLANEHPGKCTPAWLGTRAREIADAYGFEARIRGDEELEAEGFRLILAVGRGSEQESRLIHLIYRGEGPIKKRIALVGKGVTYDAGGYSIKVMPYQLNMHLDMGGSAAVLGAAEAIGRTKPPGVEVHFIVPSAENLVSGNAYKLNEIITGYGGTTVEIHNTDAEGRLLLADALAYACTFNPDEIIDLATLTGACVVALGTETAGVFCNDDGFAERFLGAANAVDESVWRMPLTERIDKHLESDFADVKNVGMRWGGAISAALFLRKFVGDHTWLHIDIAGPGMTESDWEWINKGGTGFGVAALHEYVCSQGA